MSNVFIAKSNKGSLIIHLINPIKEHRDNKVWDKFYGLSKTLPLYPQIPAPYILYSELIGKTLVLTQNFVSGTRAGKRILKKTIISDKWNAKREDVLPNILVALANIHKINLKRFGWPTLRHSSLLKGKYATWKSFFEYNYPLWLNKLHKADKRLFLEPFPKTLLNKFIKEIVKSINYSGPSVLVHGDAINPSNIIVRYKNKITLVDWEWSILADPAWEFCYLGWWKITDIKTLKPYFKASGIRKNSERINFINRINLYIPLWLLWGAYMHANDSKPDIYIALRKLLLEKIK